MIKFLKKLVNKVFKKVKVTFDESIINGLTKNYVLNLEKFETDWITGDGTSDYVKGNTHEWFSPESITLSDEEIHITSSHNPLTVNGEVFENMTGIVTSKRFFFHGYFEFLVDLPKGDYNMSTIEIFNPEGQMDFVMGNQDLSKLGILYLKDVIEVYHDDVLVKSHYNNDTNNNGVKVRVKNGFNPSVEGVKIDTDSVLKIQGLTFYRKK